MTTPFSMEEFVAIQARMQEEINRLRAESARNAALASQATEWSPSTPKIRLPEKFDGTRSKFRGFLNQVRLVLRMHPQRYPSDDAKVGLIGTLLSGTALSWLSPLLETDSPLLHDFNAFITEFEACFGDTDRVRSAATKIRRLTQGNRPASVYVSEFRQLAGDTLWNEEALIDQLRRGLRQDVQDLLAHWPEPDSLSEAISCAVRADNRLYERRQERLGSRMHAPSPASTSHHAPTYVQPHPATPSLGPTPMEVDQSRRRRPLTDQEKQFRRQNNLCLYCGQPGHIAVGCPNRRGAVRSTQVEATLSESLNDLVQSE